MKTKLITSVFILVCALSLNAQLKVNSNGSIWNGYTGYPCIYMGNITSNGYTAGQWGVEIWDDALNIYRPWPNSWNGSDYYFNITPMGNVGIGKVADPDAKLDVAGNIAIYGDIKLSSDERLKKDILPLMDKANILYKLNAKVYKKHLPNEEITLTEQKDANGKPIQSKNRTKIIKAQKETVEYGFLAQELKEVYPDLVSQDTLGYYLINYIGLIPVMVETLKEQKLQIDAQAKQIADLINNPTTGPKKIGAIVTTGLNETDALTYPVLDQNVPNPFNQSTTIGFYLPTTVTNANIYVYDMNGIQLKSYPITERGKKNILINGSEFNAGMYLYALIADGKIIDTKRMILTK